MEHRKADMRTVAGCGASVDDADRFLHELRQLRNGAGLGHAELAARAHYPYDSIRAAEVGPSLPDLPVLSAYVRGCGGTAEEWEERWRSLTRTPSLPVPAARHSGRSAAANAGARIGAAAAHAGEAPDPSVIMAALDRVAEGMAGASGTVPAPAVVQRSDPAAETPPRVPPASQPSPVPPAPQPSPVPLASQPSPVPPAPQSSPVPPAPQSSMATPASEPSPAPPASAPSPAPAGPGAVPPGPAPGAFSSDRPAGWDPIRVSSAWPAIKHTPTIASPPDRADFTAAEGAWAAAPWGEDPEGSVTADTGTPGPAGGGPASGAATAKAAAVPASAGPANPAAAAGQTARTRVVVLVAVVICVLAVLLLVLV